MKLLYITTVNPSLTGGGGLHRYANLRSICNYPDVQIDYIGPSFDYDLPGIYRNKFRNIISRDYSVKDKMIAAINKTPTSLIALFKEFIKKYSIKGHDIVFVESTLCGFIFKYLNRPNKIICNVHNVEADYFKFNVKGIKRSILYRYIFNSEKATLNYCDVALIMHNFDRVRLKNLYSIKDDDLKFILHPVCSFPPSLSLVPFDKKEKIILFMGSLDSYFNEMGLREFVKHCWPDLNNFGCKLQVAGSNPSKRLTKFLSKNKNIKIFANPLNIENILRNARMIILPDLSGTGMKVRVAQALSNGVPVVGTKKGLKGYQNITDFGIAVNNIYEMTYAIKELIYNEDKLSTLSFNTYKIWKEKYSFEVFYKRLHSILEKTLNNRL